MTGVDINLDTNIGKRLSTLSNTLTMLTGEVEADDVADEAPDDELEDTEGELPTIKVRLLDDEHRWTRVRWRCSPMREMIDELFSDEPSGLRPKRLACPYHLRCCSICSQVAGSSHTMCSAKCGMFLQQCLNIFRGLLF